MLTRTGSFPPTSVNGDWFENLEIRDVEDNSLIDLTDVTEITIKVIDPVSGLAEISLTLSNGDITIPAPGVIEWFAPATMMGTMLPKLYQIIIIVQTAEETLPVFNGPISILS